MNGTPARKERSRLQSFGPTARDIPAQGRAFAASCVSRMMQRRASPWVRFRNGACGLKARDNSANSIHTVRRSPRHTEVETHVILPEKNALMVLFLTVDVLCQCVCGMETHLSRAFSPLASYRHRTQGDALRDDTCFARCATSALPWAGISRAFGLIYSPLIHDDRTVMSGATRTLGRGMERLLLQRQIHFDSIARLHSLRASCLYRQTPRS
jgi:hypothetical protein